MTTYEHLVDATLPHGLMPLVVPQLKTITLGGAVTGLGIESSSFRNGLPHESVVEMEVLTGDGRVVIARPDNEHADLFHGFPNSYGTLGYALRLHDRAGAGPAVRARCATCGSPTASLLRGDGGDLRRDDHGGEPSTSSTASSFGAGRAVPDARRLRRRRARHVSDYTGMDIYYRSIQQRDRSTTSRVRDYLWRWDTDWFWCSRAFGVQDPRVRRLVPQAAGCARTSTGSSSPSSAATVRCGRLDRLRGRPSGRTWCRTSRCRSTGRAEFFGFLDRRGPDPARSGCARCACATPARLGAVPARTRTRPT